VTFAVLLIVAIVVFVMISNARRGSRRPVRTATTRASESEGQALRALLENQIESGADVREVLRAVRAAKSHQTDASPGSSPSESATQLADSLRVALGIATVAAAEQIVSTAPARKKAHKAKAARADVPSDAPEGLPPRGVLSALAPLPALHVRHALPPMQPLSPLAARSARS
jgi:hypothetical protein